MSCESSQVAFNNLWPKSAKSDLHKDYSFNWTTCLVNTGMSPERIRLEVNEDMAVLFEFHNMKMLQYISAL
jgi:hypothetical protein